MVHRRLRSFIAVFVSLLLVGCASGPDEDANPSSANSSNDVGCHEDDDCAQPPLRRADLLDHLLRDQDRILSRTDYKERLPPSVSEIIYGPLPDGVDRADPPVTDDDNQPYDGELQWHTVEFDDVTTDGVDHGSIRGRDVSGAHCFFARKPNRHTSIFALLAVHHPQRGDVLYLGGPHHPVTRVDTVPLTDHHGSRLRLATDHIRCAYRDDQNQQGALVVPFEAPDAAGPSSGPHYAVFTFTLGGERTRTGETRTVRRTTGVRADQTVDHEVPVRTYPRPRIDYVGTFDREYDALDAAEGEIHPGDFRLRPEFVYQRMPYLSYLPKSPEEFCPTNTRCETPRLHLDKNAIPPAHAE